MRIYIKRERDTCIDSDRHKFRIEELEVRNNSKLNRASGTIDIVSNWRRRTRESYLLVSICICTLSLYRGDDFLFPQRSNTSHSIRSSRSRVGPRARVEKFQQKRIELCIGFMEKISVRCVSSTPYESNL